MGHPRRKKKVDRNQGEIVKQLRAIPGVTVELDHDDILVGRNGKNYWFELKDPDQVSKRTGEILESAKEDSQVKLEENWQGHYQIVWSFDQIWKVISDD